MPSKPSASSSKHQQQQKVQTASKQELEAIRRYLSAKPDFDKFISQAKQNLQSAPVETRPKTEYERRVENSVKESLAARRKDREAARPKQGISMPVLPKEENTGGNLTDQVAKESEDSTASTHRHHNTGSDAKATIDDHKANPGPVISESLGQQPVASKEELRKRAEELNK